MDLINSPFYIIKKSTLELNISDRQITFEVHHNLLGFLKSFTDIIDAQDFIKNI